MVGEIWKTKHCHFIKELLEKNQGLLIVINT